MDIQWFDVKEFLPPEDDEPGQTYLAYCAGNKKMQISGTSPRRIDGKRGFWPPVTHWAYKPYPPRFIDTQKLESKGHDNER